MRRTNCRVWSVHSPVRKKVQRKSAAFRARRIPGVGWELEPASKVNATTGRVAGPRSSSVRDVGCWAGTREAGGGVGEGAGRLVATDRMLSGARLVVESLPECGCNPLRTSPG